MDSHRWDSYKKLNQVALARLADVEYAWFHCQRESGALSHACSGRFTLMHFAAI